MSRETRQLLTAALLALVSLWVLARIRFPDQQTSPNPLPALLPQLAPAPRFANLAGEIGDLQKRLSGSWLVVTASLWSGQTGEMTRRALPALRFRSDVALVLVSGGERLSLAEDVIAADRPTGLTVVRADTGTQNPAVTQWAPPDLDGPHYLMATATTPAGVSLRPVLVGSLHQTRSSAWSGPIWAVPAGTDLETGSILFTTSGELAGVATREANGPVIVPGGVVIADATRLMQLGSPPGADLRIDVQPLTDALARATGSVAGVVVAWVDPAGPSARQLMIGDVIESLNGRTVANVREWDVLMMRLSVTTLDLRVRRRGQPADVRVTLPSPEASASAASLGLVLTSVPGVGAAVVEVERGSAADAARLRTGDIITAVGGLRTPTPAQVRNAFAAAAPGGAIILALTRGDTHRVDALVK